MATPDSQLWRMADRLAGGELVEIIAQLRSDGGSHELISRKLYKEYGIEATRQTVAAWCAVLEPEPETAA